MKFVKKHMSDVIVILIAVAVVSVLVKKAEYHESKCDLEEIKSGTYARYYQTVSTVPAHNYDVVEICVNGNIRIYKGYVSITYTNKSPYAVVMLNNLANDDKVYLYVPKGTVEYGESVGVK